MLLLQPTCSMPLFLRFAKCKLEPQRIDTFGSCTNASYSFIPVYVGAAVALICGIFMKVTTLNSIMA